MYPKIPEASIPTKGDSRNVMAVLRLLTVKIADSNSISFSITIQFFTNHTMGWVYWNPIWRPLVRSRVSAEQSLSKRLKSISSVPVKMELITCLRVTFWI